jgi:hypothetical protein
MWLSCTKLSKILFVGDGHSEIHEVAVADGYSDKSVEAEDIIDEVGILGVSSHADSGDLVVT